MILFMCNYKCDINFSSTFSFFYTFANLSLIRFVVCYVKKEMKQKCKGDNVGILRNS